MFELRIATAPNALALMEQGWPTRIISLVGDDLRFHDVEAETSGYVAPTADVLKAALEHCADLTDDDRLLIHCHAGKSRSPALAIGILIAAGQTATEALTTVKALRPFIIPNRLMISLLDELLGLRGELNRVVRDHYASLPARAELPDRGGRNL